MHPTVVLLTDFGRGPYAGIVKGVILRVCPEAQIVDLTHGVTPQNVREGAWTLYTAYRYFPEGSVFMAVVDPGVGTKRAGVAVKTTRYYFVGPDNGLLYPASLDDGVVEVIRLPVPKGASKTFHARDVFAPAAAKLARGVPLNELGTTASLTRELRFLLDGRRGEIVTIDSFGNIVTNLPPVAGRGEYQVAIERGGETVFRGKLPVFQTYGDAKPETPFVLTGSFGTLEISVKDARASDLIDSRVGDAITIS